jgi:hypothetical protein
MHIAHVRKESEIMLIVVANVGVSVGKIISAKQRGREELMKDNIAVYINCTLHLLLRAFQMRRWQVWYVHLCELPEVAKECGGDWPLKNFRLHKVRIYK